MAGMVVQNRLQHHEKYSSRGGGGGSGGRSRSMTFSHASQAHLNQQRVAPCARARAWVDWPCIFSALLGAPAGLGNGIPKGKQPAGALTQIVDVKPTGRTGIFFFL